MRLEICIDVDDVERAVEFYGCGLGLTVVAHQPDWAQVEVNGQTVWIMKVAPRLHRTVSARPELVEPINPSLHCA